MREEMPRQGGLTRLPLTVPSSDESFRPDLEGELSHREASSPGEVSIFFRSTTRCWESEKESIWIPHEQCSQGIPKWSYLLL